MRPCHDRRGVTHRDERLIPPVEQPSFDFLRQQLGGVEPGPPTGIEIGGDGGGGLLAPTVAVVVAGTVILAFRRRHRRRVRY